MRTLQLPQQFAEVTRQAYKKGKGWRSKSETDWQAALCTLPTPRISGQNYFCGRIMHISSSAVGQCLSAVASPHHATAAGWLLAEMSEHFLYRRNRARIAAAF